MDRKYEGGIRPHGPGEEMAHEQDGLLRAAMAIETVGVLFFDLDGGIIGANRGFERMSGYSSGELHNCIHWNRLTAEEFAGLTAETAARLEKDGVTPPYEKQMVRKDGSRWWGLFAPRRLSGSKCVEFILDISERKAAEQALRDADRRKDEFLATLAHELRNPLAPISNAVHLLGRPDGRRRADRLVPMLERQVRQIVRLVDDLMEMSRISRGKLQLAAELVDLHAIIDTAVETSMPLIQQGRHRLDVDLPPEPLLLHADRVRLAQVFSNLLNNAAKFTEPGGAIRLAAGDDDGEAVVKLIDNGVGIDAEALPRVFEMFAQVHPQHARGMTGLGIGLTMVRSLVEMHGGTVSAASAGPGQGSCFEVRLPLAREAVGDVAQGQPAVADEGGFAGARVLVVDDNRDAADSLAMLLGAFGAEVRVAYDGPAALEQAQGFAAQVVLLDLGLPGMDGFEIARRMLHVPMPSMPVLVALTGWGQEADRQATRACGFDHHLTKPVDMDALARIIGDAVGCGAAKA